MFSLWLACFSLRIISRSERRGDAPQAKKLSTGFRSLFGYLPPTHVKQERQPKPITQGTNCFWQEHRHFVCVATGHYARLLVFSGQNARWAAQAEKPVFLCHGV
jgi:hypothetical protein